MSEHLSSTTLQDDSSLIDLLDVDIPGTDILQSLNVDSCFWSHTPSAQDVSHSSFDTLPLMSDVLENSPLSFQNTSPTTPPNAATTMQTIELLSPVGLETIQGRGQYYVVQEPLKLDTLAVPSLQIPSPDGQFVPPPDTTTKVLEAASQRVARSPRSRRTSINSSGYASPQSGFATPRSGMTTPRSGSMTPQTPHSGVTTPPTFMEAKSVKLPRHKRESHINAEYRRRSKIQKGLDDIMRLVPSIAENPGTIKDSKAVILGKTASFCRSLRNEVKQQQREVEAKRLEVFNLCAEINLPPGCASTVDTANIILAQQNISDILGQSSLGPKPEMLQMFHDYVRAKTFQNWKFWIFGLILRPLFDSYMTSVNTHSEEELTASMSLWLQNKMSLPSLRRNCFTALRELSTKSSVMTSPESLATDAVKAVLDEPDLATIDKQQSVIHVAKGAAITVKPVGVTSPALMVTGVPLVHAAQPTCPPIVEEDEEKMMDHS